MNTEDLGPIAGEAFDRQLGRFNALHGLKDQITRQELLARANTIAVYCGFKALKAYSQELDDAGISTPYRFSAEQIEGVDRKHEGMQFLAVMDVYEMAKNGAELGWKREWCLVSRACRNSVARSVSRRSVRRAVAGGRGVAG